MYIGLHVKYRLLLSDLNKTFRVSLSKNNRISNFRPVGAELFHADRRTDRPDAANAPKRTPLLLRHTCLEQFKFLPQCDAVNIGVTGICDNYQTLFCFSCSVHHLVQQYTTHTHTHTLHTHTHTHTTHTHTNTHTHTTHTHMQSDTLLR
jgi:hypothetical protein